MNTRWTTLIISLAALLVFSFFIFSNSVFANAWWGYGARDRDWILKHERTIVKCEIDNHHGDSSEYKMVMYNDDGRYVEKEFGTRVTFDDAKEGDYKISAYRGGTEDRTTYKGGKKFASIEFTAHPGETIRIEFDYKKKKAKMTTDYVEPQTKPVVKKVLAPMPDAEDTELQETTVAPENEQTSESVETAPEVAVAVEPTVPEPPAELPVPQQRTSIFEAIENFFHPDAMAMENNQDSLTIQNEKYKSVFRGMWQSMLNYFTFL